MLVTVQSVSFEPRARRGRVVFDVFGVFLTSSDALYQRTATFQVKSASVVLSVSKRSRASCIWSIWTRLWSFYHITDCVWGSKPFVSGQLQCFAVFSECSFRVNAVTWGVEYAQSSLDRGTNVDVSGKLQAIAVLSPPSLPFLPRWSSPQLASLR
jgi:hypothetical protein